MAAIKSMLDSWVNSPPSSEYLAAKQESEDFATYKRTLKRTWVGHKADLAGLLGNISTKLKTYEMKPYEPPHGLSLLVCVAPMTML